MSTRQVKWMRQFRLSAVMALAACAAGAAGATFTVTSTADTDDTNVGTLRWAAAQAYSNPGSDRIEFNIPGTGVHTITLSGSIGMDDDTYIVDGTTQPGYSGTPLIEISGNNAVGHGLYFGGSTGSKVLGLCVNGFTNACVKFETCNECIIQGCYLGTDPTGESAVAGSFNGVAIYYGGDANVIGGTGTGEGNVFGTDSIVIDVMGATNSVIQGNFIGTNPAGTAVWGHTKAIRINSVNGPGSGTLVGGSATNAGNVIVNSGIGIENNGADTVVQGNRFGVTSSGAAGAVGTAILNTDVTAFVGGTGVGEGNIFANFNTGISLAAGSNARASRILGNVFYANNGLRIDFDANGSTANDNPDNDGITNSPVLGTADSSVPGQVTIPTTLQAKASTAYLIEYYRVEPGNSAAQFLYRLTASTNGSGSLAVSPTITTPLPPTGQVIATATPVTPGVTGSSEFSPSVALPVALSRFGVE